MSFNPYSPPAHDISLCEAPELQTVDRQTQFSALLRSLPFSFVGGLLAAAVWGFGTTTFRMTVFQMYTLFGLIFGFVISGSFIFVGLCRQWSIPSCCLRLSIVIVGCTVGKMMTPILYTSYRTMGWHITWRQYPWSWVIALEVPRLLMMMTICLSLRVVRLLSWKRALRVFGVGLIFSVLCNGTIDNLMPPKSTVTDHLTQRAIMLTLWFVSVIATIVYQVTSQRQVPTDSAGVNQE